MTVYMSLREFITALKEEQSRITRALERAANDREVRRAYGDDLRKPGNFSGPVPAWLRDQMKKHGADDRDVAHAGAWPSREQEVAREAIAAAFEEDRDIRFAWDSRQAERSFTEVSRSPNGDTKIVFVTARHTLRVSDDNLVYDEPETPAS